MAWLGNYTKKIKDYADQQNLDNPMIRNNTNTGAPLTGYTKNASDNVVNGQVPVGSGLMIGPKGTAGALKTVGTGGTDTGGATEELPPLPGTTPLPDYKPNIPVVKLLPPPETTPLPDYNPNIPAVNNYTLAPVDTPDAGDDLQTSLTDTVQNRLTGKSEDIKSMEATYNRDVSRMRYSAMQEARSLAAQKGYAPGSEQYNQLMRNANQQINDAEQSGRESLFKNVREVRTEAIAQATTLADMLWSQKRTAGLDDQQKLKDLMATVPHAAVKNILGTMNWSQAEKFMKEATYPQGHEKAGQFKDEYYDNNWDQMYTEATNLARAESLKDGTPFDPESEASKTIIGNQMYNLLKAQARPGETASDDADKATAVETLQNLLKAGSTPTSAQVIAAIDTVAVDKIPTFSATAKEKATDNGGWMNVNNKAIQVIDGGKFKRKDGGTWRDDKYDEYAVIKYDGKTYYFINKGEWYDSVPTKALRDGGKQITNPLAQEKI